MGIFRVNHIMHRYQAQIEMEKFLTFESFGSLKTLLQLTGVYQTPFRL